MFKIGIVNRIASFFPGLKSELRIAHLPYNPSDYVKKSLKSAALNSFLLSVLFFLVIKKAGLPLLLIAPVFIILSVLLFGYSLLKVKSKIRQREREINKEVLFVGRYLLVKLYSGRPLLNALTETAGGRGVAAKYIKEIVDDIGTGSTIEDALNSAMVYSPSEKLRKILFHVNNALQLGIDVTKPLESVLGELTREEALEIKKYGKKINTLVVFYMLAAVILPSLGVALLMIISSFISFPMDMQGLLIFLFFIAVLEFVFIALFKSIRPMVNL